MRNQILDVGAKKLNYEIREVVVFAQEIEKLGQQITWENIGDPGYQRRTGSNMDKKNCSESSR